MSTKYRFEELSEANQERARAGFVDARKGDDYWYELNIDGVLLCRTRHWFIKREQHNQTGNPHE